MKILLVAATEEEIRPFREASFDTHKVNYLVAGIGMTSTAYTLTKELNRNTYDLCINIGLAGAFDRKLNIGEVVEVVEDWFTELGAEDGDEFLSLQQMGLAGIVRVASTQHAISSSLLPFRNVKGITVNTVHGNDISIEKIISRFHPQIETMEGAAFIYVCSQEGIPALQLRSISNYVERRNRDAWNIPLALTTLRKAVIELIGQL
jgi:futalosine hydrolase